jgi:hypothetical protein
MKEHNCTEHIVRRVQPRPRNFSSGGKVSNWCGVCGRRVNLVMRSNEVLMRVRRHGN